MSADHVLHASNEICNKSFVQNAFSFLLIKRDMQGATQKERTPMVRYISVLLSISPTTNKLQMRS